MPGNLGLHRARVRSALQVGQGHNAAYPSLRIDDRYATDPFPGHQIGALLQVGVLSQSYRRARHAVLRAHLFGIVSVRHKTNHDIPIRYHADRFFVMHDRYLANIIVQHLASYFAQVRGSGGHDGIRRHYVLDFH